MFLQSLMRVAQLCVVLLSPCQQGTATSCTDTAGSDCTDDTCGSVFEEVETVFNMTGQLPAGEQRHLQSIPGIPSVHHSECLHTELL